MSEPVVDWHSEAVARVVEGRELADLVTVVAAPSGGPVEVGARLLILPDGSTTGGLGDSGLDGAATADGARALQDRKSQVIRYAVAGAPEADGVEVFHEVLEPQPQLVIVGAGHIAVPLARYAKILGFEVVVVDDRDKYASVERFPDADQVIAADFGETLRDFPLTPATFVVIITRAHTYDEEALRLTLHRPTAYIGMIGSRRRVQTVLRTLAGEGYAEERLRTVRAPIGLDIGSDTPEEIALAIIAEVVATRRGGTGRPLSSQIRPIAV